MKFLIMQLCPASYYKLPHIHIFLWQPGLKPLQSMFFPYYEKLSFMIVQNYRTHILQESTLS